MSSKARAVEHGGVTWKVIPGSRREQLLERFIRQDNALHHVDVAVEPGRPYGLREKIEGYGVIVVVTLLIGFAAGLFVRVIQTVIGDYS